MAEAQFRTSKYFIEVAILHSFFKQFYCYFKMEKMKSGREETQREKKHYSALCQVMLNT